MARRDTMDDTTYKIEQRRFLRGRQTLTIEDDKLKAEYRRGLSLHEYQFDLRGFLPEPVRIRRVPLARILGVILLAVAGATCIALGCMATDVNTIIRLLLSGPLLLSFAAMTYMPIPGEMVDVFLFEGPGGPLGVWANCRNPQELQEFLTVLTVRIRNARQYEVNLLRSLRQVGILDDWRYGQALELLQKQGHPEAA
jgi:hypothetical protein